MPRIPEPAPDWVDWVVVHRLITGRPVGPRKPTEGEVEQAALYLIERGASITSLARDLHRNGQRAAELMRRLAPAPPAR